MRGKYLVTVAGGLFLALYSALALAQTLETAKPIQASAVLPANVLKGPFHSVKPEVQNDGMTNYYQVDSKFGQFKAVGTLNLYKLVFELAAIDKMIKVKSEDTLGSSLKKSGENTWRGIKNLFSDPQGALEGSARGLGSLFNRAGEAMKSGRSKSEDSAFEQVVGIAAAKREVAYKFGVDVYSRNKVLQENLERIAYADYSGTLGAVAALSMVPGAGGVALTASGTTRLLNDVISKSPPAELRLRNRKTLQEMGIDQDLTSLFIDNPNFSPRQQTVFCEAVNSMKGAQNRSLFIKVALQAQNQDWASVMTSIAALYAGYHKNIGPLAAFNPLARVLFAVSKKGSVVVAVPADYMIWSERMLEGSAQLEKYAKKTGRKSGFELWLVGKVSPRAQKELQARGWSVNEECHLKLLPRSGKGK